MIDSPANTLLLAEIRTSADHVMSRSGKRRQEMASFFAADAYGSAYTRGGAASWLHFHLALFERQNPRS